MRNIPFVEVEGNNYEIGFEIGKKCKHQIRKLLKINSKRYVRISGLEFNELLEKSRNFLHHSMKNFPRYVEELVGMSCGSKVDFNQLFLLSCEEELISPVKKCTSIVAITPDNNIIIGHNEDWSREYANQMYLIKAKQPNYPDFLSLSHIGSSPGSSIGFNDKGIGFTGNSLPFKRFRYGIPRNLICRSVLDAKDSKEASKNVKIKKRAISSNSIIVSKEQSIIDIETSFEAFGRIVPDEKFLVHTNHIVSERLRHLKKTVSKESVRRYEKAIKILKENENRMDIELIKRILQDHETGICSHFDKKRSYMGVTIASVIVDMNNKMMHIANGNPCKSEYKEYKLSFN